MHYACRHADVRSYMCTYMHVHACTYVYTRCMCIYVLMHASLCMCVWCVNMYICFDAREFVYVCMVCEHVISSETL